MAESATAAAIATVIATDAEGFESEIFEPTAEFFEDEVKTVEVYTPPMASCLLDRYGRILQKQSNPNNRGKSKKTLAGQCVPITALLADDGVGIWDEKSSRTGRALLAYDRDALVSLGGFSEAEHDYEVKLLPRHFHTLGFYDSQATFLAVYDDMGVLNREQILNYYRDNRSDLIGKLLDSPKPKVPCKNGHDCWYFQNGKCKYAHDV